jgi:hypothetical protein
VTEALRAPFWHFWHPDRSAYLEKRPTLFTPTQLHEGIVFHPTHVCELGSSLRQ